MAGIPRLRFLQLPPPARRVAPPLPQKQIRYFLKLTLAPPPVRFPTRHKILNFPHAPAQIGTHSGFCESPHHPKQEHPCRFREFPFRRAQSLSSFRRSLSR